MSQAETFEVWKDATGCFHRDGDLPAIEYPNKAKAGELPNKPKLWFVRGLLHRDGGRPAVVSAHGEKEYWVRGQRVTPVAYLPRLVF